MKEKSINDRLLEICAYHGKSIQAFRALIPDSLGESSTTVFNLINELHLDNKNMYENAHTRVLAAVLRYDQRFLDSFLARCGVQHSHIRINGKIEVDVERQYTKEGNDWVVGKKRVEQQNSNNCRPDCLVWKRGQFAVIIENKINGAPETDKQIDHYIEAISGEKDIKLRNNDYIWVIYLGGDSEDMPSQKSLSLKNTLYVKGSGDNRRAGKHLRLVSYKNTIIPWLEEDVLPICPFGLSSLTGGLLVYIDYLKKRFTNSSSDEIRFFDSKKVVDFFRDVERESKDPFYKLYKDAKDYIDIANEDDENYIFFKALKHFYLNHHFRFHDQKHNKNWTISASGSLVYVWKNNWNTNLTKSHSIADLYFKLYPYQIDTFMLDPAKFKLSVHCSLEFKEYKGKDEKLIKYLKDNGINIGDGEHMFDKAKQIKGHKLILDQDGKFFDSFVKDDAIKNLCSRIDELLIKYYSGIDQ